MAESRAHDPDVFDAALARGSEASLREIVDRAIGEGCEP